MAVYEAGRSGRTTEVLATRCEAFVRSDFLPDVPWGTSKDGIRSENLEALSFPDESFDVIVTQDVLEHVFEPRTAFAEIARVLRSPGHHIFTVPLDLGRPTRPRAKRTANGITHLLTPEFHDDPLSAGVLVVTDWGCDLPDIISEVTGMTTQIQEVVDPSGKLDTPIRVLVSHKS
jgi:SAM-dependent methyltransferase